MSCLIHCLITAFCDCNTFILLNKTVTSSISGLKIDTTEKFRLAYMPEEYAYGETCLLTQTLPCSGVTTQAISSSVEPCSPGYGR